MNDRYPGMDPRVVSEVIHALALAGNEAPVVRDAVITMPKLGCRVVDEPTRSVWLCHVCLRVPLTGTKPWGWFACDTCRDVDAVAANALGGRQLLALGRYSMMNDVGLALRDESPDSDRYARNQHDAMARDWQTLGVWFAEESERMVRAWGSLGNDVEGEVAQQAWQSVFAPSVRASCDAYSRLIADHFSTYGSAAPDILDSSWLEERTRV